MTSLLIDGVLVAALCFTSWRTIVMYRELRRLRDESAGFGGALEASEQAINKAAHAVVTLKYEGVQTLRALEDRSDEARAILSRLETLVARADWHCRGGAAADVDVDVAPEPTAMKVVGRDRHDRHASVSHQPRPLGQDVRVLHRASAI
ncbi:hypothetical protein NPA31_001775 [Aurantimonas sp. MSK8Z-1]|uniref:hypothetical protein n=1 Tax=Mangrovibrevibacter kandeliae TaxID=2968473 RepID=UPI0021180D29|nr:hypothetical protein [Aurantimonas sp. MSK8Z-1]MCW4113690.1 hypothetical protein [Aurantimonas sp. MSK8Z-1]